MAEEGNDYLIYAKNYSYSDTSEETANTIEYFYDTLSNSTITAIVGYDTGNLNTTINALYNGSNLIKLPLSYSNLPDTSAVGTYAITATAAIPEGYVLADGVSNQFTFTLIIVYGGKCGDSAYWMLKPDGELYIYGGATYDYDNTADNKVPWHDHIDDITSVDIANSVTAFGDGLFSDLKISTMEIPYVMAEINPRAFRGMPNLQNVSITWNSEMTHTTIDGNVYTTDYSTLILYADKVSTGTGYIEEYATTISDYAFEDCKLSSVAITPGVTSIADNAFYNCPDITIRAVRDSYAYNYAVQKGMKVEVVDATISSITAPQNISVMVGEEIPYHTAVVAKTVYNDEITLNVTYDTKPTSDVIGAYTVTGTVGIPDGYVLSSSLSDKITYTVNVEAARGQCGDNLVWSYENGVLTITGNGDMYEQDTMPWAYLGADITQISLPEGLTSIAGGILSGTSVSTITIPSTVSKITQGAFSGSMLAEINVSEDNAYYAAVDGVLYDKDIATLYCYPAYKSGDEFTIPDTVINIEYGAFENCQYLKKLTMGDNVAYIAQTGLEGSDIELFVPEGSAAYDYAVENGITHTAIPGVVMSGTKSNLTYTIYTNGLLYLECDGAISNISPPWKYYDVTIAEAEFAEGVTGTKSAILEDLSDLKTIKLPSTFAGSEFIDNCPNVTEITVAEGNESMFTAGKGLYYKSGPYYTELVYIFCGDDTTFTMEYAAEGIDYKTFLDNDKLEVINLRSTAYSIGSAFKSCPNLKEINVIDSEDNSLSSENGILYNGDKSRLIRVPSGHSATSFTVPDTVTRFSNYAFSDCDNLVSVTMSDNNLIPEGLGEAGLNLFYGCDKLETVRLSDNIESIPQNAFENCSSLKTINFPSKLTDISSSAFLNCTSLTELPEFPETLTSVGDNAFTNTSVTEVTYPSTLTSCGYIFEDCPLLEKVIFKEGTTKIGLGEFKNCPKLTEVILPSTIENVGNGAFRDCVALTKAVIPSGEVGTYVFEDCTGLTDVTLGENITAINSYAFAGCTNLENIEIPSGTIGQSAFSGCVALGTVTLGDQVTSIGRRAFEDCTSLTEITIPESVTTLSTYMFDDCTGLKEVYINSSANIPANAFDGCENIEVIELSSAIESIGNYAFRNTAISKIDLPDALTTLGYCVFNGCVKLVEIEIPSGVAAVDTTSFYNCTSLESIKINEGTTTIDGDIYECPALSEIYIPASVTSIYDGFFYYILESEQDVTVITPAGSYAEEFALSKGISVDNNYYTVIESIEGVDRLCDQQVYVGTAVNLPNEVIAYTADGEQLTLSVSYSEEVDTSKANSQNIIATIEIPQWYILIDGLSNTITFTVNTIEKPISGGDSADEGVNWSYKDGVLIISGKGEMASYDPYGDNIAPWITEYGKEITSIVIESGVTTAGRYAFYGLSNVETIQIADTVTKLCAGTFQGTGIKEIYIPNSITEMEENAFANCISLQSIVFPSSMTTVPYCVFFGCTGLELVRFTSVITFIDGGAFADCSAIKTVYYPGTKAQWDKITFEKDNDYLTSANIICTGREELPELEHKYEQNTETGAVSISVTIPEGTVDAEGGELLVIGIGSDGISSIEPKEVTEKDTSLDDITVEGSNVKTVKIFLWQDLNSMIPLSEPVEITIGK